MQPRTRRVAAAVITAVLLLTGSVGCRKSEPDPLEEEIISLQDRTMPSGAALVEKSNLLRDGRTASASWEYETDWEWEEYASWVRNNLAVDYKEITRRDGTLEFRRQLPGDVYELQVESSTPNTVRRIRVNFRARPD